MYAPPLKPLELVLVRLDFRRDVADGAYAPPLQPLELFLVRLDFSCNNERVRSLSLRFLKFPLFSVEWLIAALRLPSHSKAPEGPVVLDPRVRPLLDASR